MSQTPHIHKLSIHDPIHPFPLSLLARQLELLFLGIPTSTIFCFEGDLVKDYHPSDPSDGIVPFSRQAFLLHRFLTVPTCRWCTVKGIDQETQLNKRCNEFSSGFRQILKHQRKDHNRNRHYICIVEECMAIFDKVGNAKRHADTMHNAESLRKRHVTQARIRCEMHCFIKSAQKRTEQTRKRHDSIERRKRIQRMRPRRAMESVKVAHEEKMKPTVTLRMRLRPSVLHLRSIIKQDSAQQNMHVEIFPSAFTRLHVGDFHKKNIRRGRFHGRITNILQLEWVAVTGMMDLYYGRRNVKYRFVKSFFSIPMRLKVIAPALPKDSV